MKKLPETQTHTEMPPCNISRRIVWICGKYLGPQSWDFQGVFSSEGLAISACRGESYFIGPAVLDEQVPDKTMVWPGCYYPHLEQGAHGSQ